jgi:hypothetical protein
LQNEKVEEVATSSLLLDPIYRFNQKTKMSLWAEKEITSNEWYFDLISTMSHPMPSD